MLASVVAEVYGRPDHRYDDLLAAADTVRARLAREPGVVDVDDVREAAAAEAHLRHRQGEGRPQRRHAPSRSPPRFAAAARRRRRRHWCAATPNATRCASNCACRADRRSSAADLARVARQGRDRPTGAAGRTGPLGSRRASTRRSTTRTSSAWPTSSPRPPAGRRPTSSSTSRPIERSAAGSAAEAAARRQRLGRARRTPQPVARPHLLLQRQRHRLGRARRLQRRLRRRRRVEDHARRLPRPGPGLRRRPGRHLHPAGRPDRLVRHPRRRHAGHPADDPRRHARLLAAQRAQRPARRRLSSTRSSSPPPA